MPRKRRVFILGAGMSAACGNPTLAQFMQKRFTKNIPQNILNDIKSFIDAVYPRGSKPNIEMLLTLVDHMISRQQSIGAYDIIELHKLRKKIIYLIIMVLYNVHLQITTELGIPLSSEDRVRYDGIQSLSELFFDRSLFPKPKTMSSKIRGYHDTYFKLSRILNKGDTVITLNYDLLIDHALESLTLENALRDPEKVITIDYGINCTSLNRAGDLINLMERYRLAESKQAFYRKFVGKPMDIIDGGFKITEVIFLLKLHGSINWSIFNGHIAMSVLTPELLKHGPKAYRGGYNLIVPPTWMKDYSNRILEDISVTAAENISRADEIIFIGYSFAESDFQIRYIFNSAMLQRKRKSWPRITVVDPNIGNVEYAYKKFFGKIETQEMTAAEFLRDFQ